jgi:hypothetical protein
MSRRSVAPAGTGDWANKKVLLMQLRVDKGNQSVGVVAQTILWQKDLDTIAIHTLYKTARAIAVARSVRKNLMLKLRTHKEHSMKWQPCAALYSVVCSLGVTSSAINTFGGRPGQETSDSRQYKQ